LFAVDERPSAAGGPNGFCWRPWPGTLGTVYDFDLLVLGSGPGGQKAAIAAAKLGRRVGIVERRHMIGGV
jgi:NAD(P) transhydrogenase